MVYMNHIDIFAPLTYSFASCLRFIELSYRDCNARFGFSPRRWERWLTSPCDIKTLLTWVFPSMQNLSTNRWFLFMKGLWIILIMFLKSFWKENSKIMKNIFWCFKQFESFISQISWSLAVIVICYCEVIQISSHPPTVPVISQRLSYLLISWWCHRH